MEEEWYVVAYHNSTGFRSVLPVAWETREKAEEVRRVAQMLMPPDFRTVVEQGDGA